MATKAQGINKVVTYAPETVWGEISVANGKQIRRVTADFSLVKESYSSNEIRTDYQTSDMRHGVRSVEGSINGELSPGSYSDFFAAILARNFTTVVGVNDADVTIAAAGTNFTITRSDVAGDYLADGIKVGHIVRMTGVGLNAANAGNNLLVISVTATVLTVKVLSSVSLIAEGPISAVDIAPVGKETYIPQTGHLDPSFTVEQWYSDIEQSEVFTGVKFSSANIALPATGLVTVDFSATGKDLAQVGVSQEFSSATAPNVKGIFASVQGALLVNGSEAGCITDASIGIERATENSTCVGSDSISEIFVGKISATGSLSVYFNPTMRDYFSAETEVTIVLALTTSEAKDADAMSITLPRVKLGSATAADAELGITQSVDFTALLKDTNVNGLVNSTIQIQDTSI